MTEVEAHMATYSLVCYRSSMASCPRAVQISITMGLRSLRVRDNVRNSLQVMTLVLSLVYALTVAALGVGIRMQYLLVKTYQRIYLFVTNPALCNGKLLVNQCAARSGSPADDKSSH